MMVSFDKTDGEERLTKCLQAIYTQLGEPNHPDKPVGDFDHIPMNYEMLSLLGNGMTASGAKADALADPVKMATILRFENWFYRATSGRDRDPGLWYHMAGVKRERDTT